MKRIVQAYTLVNYYVVSAKEVTSISLITTTILENFYGEMGFTRTMTVRIYSPVTSLAFKRTYFQ